jgi:hypothetical protein
LVVFAFRSGPFFDERVTRHVRVAGVASELPAESVAYTRKVCVTYARPLYDFGDAHLT